MKIMIKTNGLSKYYGKGGKIKAVDDLTLEVYEKETFGLLGPNGAGKTTVARASEKFFEVDQSGTYTITVYIWCSKWNSPYSVSHWEKIYDTAHILNWPENDPIQILNFKINNDTYWPAFLELE
jgi:ABC-type glutathione transport system ATPase component